MSFVAPRSPARKVRPQSCTHWLTSAAKPTAATMGSASRKDSPSAESAAGPRKGGIASRLASLPLQAAEAPRGPV